MSDVIDANLQDGDEINVRMRILKIDSSDLPYFVSPVGMDSDYAVWYPKDEFERAAMLADPKAALEIKKKQLAKLQEEIDTLEKEEKENDY